jgi:ATP-binding cassette, subfamily B, bacterial MsbA
MLFTLRNLHEIFRLVRGGIPLFYSTLLLSLLAALGEALGIFVFIPLLQSTGATLTVPAFPFLTGLTARLNDLAFDRRIQIVATIIIIVVVVRATMEFLNRIVVNLVRMLVQRRLAEDVFASVLFANQNYLDRQIGGRMTIQIQTFVFQISRIIANYGNLIFNAILMVCYVAMMVIVSIQLTLLSLVAMLLVSAVFTLVLYEQNRFGRDLVQKNVEYQQMISESLSNVRMLRLLSAEGARIASFAKLIRGKFRIEFMMYSINSLVQPMFTLSGGLFFAAALFVGAWRFGSSDSGWLSSTILFIVILYRMMVPISAINSARAELRGDLPILFELQQFRAECRENRFVNGDRPFEKLESGIVFENVAFSHELNAADDHPAKVWRLLNFSTKINRGEMIALVGPSGSGKTTIVNLLVRLYDPTGGRISIDGTDLRDIDVYELRKRIGFVSQDVTLFHGTIADNLKVVNQSASRREMEAALVAAGASEVLTATACGLDTVVGERGATLSGGQRQRVALARALLQKPDILILDEATNQLDSLIEREVTETIAKLRGQTTIIAIAHRLSTVVDANRILVLEDGKIVQEGRHAALFAQEGLYRRLWNAQSHDVAGLSVSRSA